jgi:hypothetical protein
LKNSKNAWQQKATTTEATHKNFQLHHRGNELFFDLRCGPILFGSVATAMVQLIKTKRKNEAGS